MRRGAPVRASCSRSGAAIQLVPLAAPLLLSTDAWTYWGYGWIASDGGGNPYVDPPADFPQSPAADYVGADWRDTTTVYGPVFTLLSEPVRSLAGSSPDAAAWLFKGLAAAAVLVATAAVARAAARPALAAPLVGWNPVLAIHLAGGGHNDALVGALAALASRSRAPPAAPRRRRVDARDRGEVGARPVPRARRPRRPRARETHGAARRPRRPRSPIGAVATWRYGLDWLRRLRPLAENAVRETSYALPVAARAARAPPRASRSALALAIAAVEGSRGSRGTPGAGCRATAAPHVSCSRRRPTSRSGTSPGPFRSPPADEDRVARVAALALTAYLLPQTIPL